MSFYRERTYHTYLPFVYEITGVTLEHKYCLFIPPLIGGAKEVTGMAVK